MYKRLWTLVLSLALAFASFHSALAASRGPASTVEELRTLLASAHENDVILVTGEIAFEVDEPLTSPVSVRIASQGDVPAVLRGLHLRDASISFSNIHLTDALHIAGTSHIHLRSGVHVSGDEGESALSFSGNGTLIVDRGCVITGGDGSTGVSISHNTGEFYASLEGSIAGGSGYTGGAGVVVSPLGSAGAMMISGSIRGGDGDVMGGHALNLYDLSGNAFVTIDGDLRGGSGSIGGDGVQLVSAVDSVSVGITGQVKGGSGDAYGGDAIMLMNAEGASSIHLSGEFSGGNAIGADAQPGTALLMVGDVTAMRARVNDCLLEDGSRVGSTAMPAARVTPLPEITSSIDDVETLAPPSEAAPDAASDSHGEATPGEAF